MPESPEIFEQAMSNLPDTFSPQLLFLDADRNTLIRRYSDTRRLHPLSSKNLSLESAIDEESDLLEPLRSRADLIVDTSEMSVHELAEMLRTRLLGKRERELTMVFESFGFKHGIPIDADYVFDVRFLPNPHWDPKLRPMTGLDKPVAAFLDRHTEVHNFIYQTRSYLELWLPMLETNNRSYLTVAIGCTGGKHRSVYIAEQLADYFRSRGKNVQSRHRTLEKRKTHNAIIPAATKPCQTLYFIFSAASFAFGAINRKTKIPIIAKRTRMLYKTAYSSAPFPAIPKN